MNEAKGTYFDKRLCSFFVLEETMVQCLRKYEWVKLPRSRLSEGRGIMGAWARLASHAAFRKGQALYCGYSNEVMPGMWSGGIVGLKKILGVKNRQTALDIMNRLSEYGYLSYTLEAKTKKFTYRILDWVVRCSGRACTEGSVYAIDGYGLLCLPRNLTERLVERGHIFEEADAWLDLWCHTVARDPRNAFSCLAPAIQYRGASITLETLGTRWGWEKTKVWRFFKKHGDKYNIYVTWVSGVDEDLNPVDMATMNGEISIISYIPGDVNGDETIDIADVILIRRYITGGYGVEVPENAADVNKDGVVDIADVILIRRYITGGYGVVLK